MDFFFIMRVQWTFHYEGTTDFSLGGYNEG